MRALAFAATFGRNSVRSETSRVVGRADVEADFKKRSVMRPRRPPCPRPGLGHRQVCGMKASEKTNTLSTRRRGQAQGPGLMTRRFLKSAQTLSPSPPGFVVGVALPMAIHQRPTAIGSRSINNANPVITPWRWVCSPARPHRPMQNSPSRATWCRPIAAAARPAHHRNLHPSAGPGSARLAHPDAAA